MRVDHRGFLARRAPARKVAGIVTDEQREAAIERYRLKLVEARDPLTKRIAALRMKELISARTPEQVLKMEIERGLR